MTRPSQLLHPAREPAPARAAATLLLLRDGPKGLEVLMTRRSHTASFAPGAYVFPGGGIDAADALAHDLTQRRPGQTDTQLNSAIAAIRECFEELGVLLACRSDGTTVGQSDVDQLDRRASLVAQCREHRLSLQASEVHLLARWITDLDMPRRFDVPFLVARMPEDQTPVADESEQFDPVWVSPAEALTQHSAGQFFMIFPTVRTLEWLQNQTSADAVLRACAVSEEPLWTSCPRAGLMNGRETRFMESDLPYGELAMVCPHGHIVHPLQWQCETAVPLLNNVTRLTAPNPGAMTGPGTNSYLVGDPHTGYIAIDPGPADAAHVQKLWRAAGGDIRWIVCTHSHPDHSPGARPLQELCADSPHGPPPIMGLASQATARAASKFEPDRTLGHRQCLSLRDQHGEIQHSLLALHTPGHAANHLCLVLQEDGLLFSGDHVLNGSTTVIDPPDGNMNDYLDSLDLLQAVCTELKVAFILPAHGYVIGQAQAAISRLKTHRLQREEKIRKAMQVRPEGSVDDWLALAYQDVPQRLWPVAKRSLLAHIQRIEALG